MADSDAVALSGRWWRQVPHGIHPLERPAVPKDGRWQRGAIVDAIYLADSHDTAVAEWYRWLAEFGLPPERALPVDVWEVDVDLTEVADLSADERLAAEGLAPPVPDRRSWSPYQAVGERLAAEGISAIVAPSSARAGGQTLCVFVAGSGLASLSPVSRRRTHRRPPAPPRGLRT